MLVIQMINAIISIFFEDGSVMVFLYNENYNIRNNFMIKKLRCDNQECNIQISGTISIMTSRVSHFIWALDRSACCAHTKRVHNSDFLIYSTDFPANERTYGGNKMFFSFLALLMALGLGSHWSSGKL